MLLLKNRLYFKEIITSNLKQLELKYLIERSTPNFFC